MTMLQFIAPQPPKPTIDPMHDTVFQHIFQLLHATLVRI